MWSRRKAKKWSASTFFPKQWKIKIPGRYNPLKQLKAAKDINTLKRAETDVDDPLIALIKSNRYAKLYRYAARSIWNESWWDWRTESKGKKSTINFRGFGKEKFRYVDWY
jgi:hypothetical protein